MAEKKAHEVEAWLKRPDAAIPIVLLYGTDRGLVSERASAYAASTGVPLDDPFSVIRLDGNDIDKDPERLAVEAGTVPMFGGDRLIWIRNAGQGAGLASEIKALTDAPPTATRILVEAGELKKTAPLRTTIERARTAIALPCYADESRTLDTLIDTVLGAAGMRIDADARHLLKSNLGGDRLASRGELEKLVLYAQGSDVIRREDVAAATGDSSETTVDVLIDAVLVGDRMSLDQAFSALARIGGLGSVPTFLQRQFQQLELWCTELDAGKSASSVVAGARPPIFFSRRKTIETALQRWNSKSVASANAAIFDGVYRMRRDGTSTGAELHRLLLQLWALPR